MNKHQIEQSDIDGQMLSPELIVAEPGRTGKFDGGSQQCEQRTGEQPEIADVEQCLGFANYRKAEENGRPAADCDGEIFLGIGT